MKQVMAEHVENSPAGFRFTLFEYGLEPFFVLDDVSRTFFCFKVHFADVFANDTEA